MDGEFDYTKIVYVFRFARRDGRWVATDHGHLVRIADDSEEWGRWGDGDSHIEQSGDTLTVRAHSRAFSLHEDFKEGWHFVRYVLEDDLPEEEFVYPPPEVGLS